VSTFVIAGICAALAGTIAASRVLGVSVNSGGGTLMLEAIAAAVIGGASLFGGRGTVWAALLGALVIGSISNGMDLRGMSTEVKLLVEGAILILAVTTDVIIARGRVRPTAAAAGPS
jgi:D-xylose transport system permease protein